MFGRQWIRAYELGFVILGSVAASSLATDLKALASPFEVAADVFLLVSAICLFAVYVPLAAIWEDKLRDMDPIESYNLALDKQKQKKLSRRVRFAAIALFLSLLSVGLHHLNSMSSTVKEPNLQSQLKILREGIDMLQNDSQKMNQKLDRLGNQPKLLEFAREFFKEGVD